MTARPDVSPVQVADTVWLVATAEQCAAYTSRYDGNAYLVWDGQAGVLVDAGSGLAGSSWLAAVASVAPLDSLAGVLITHYHGDHAGGAADATSAGLDVLASPLTVDALADADENVTQVARARAVGVYPPEFSLRASPARALTAGEELSCGTFRIIALDAPGHCDGHLVFELVGPSGSLGLFTGDTVFPGGRVSMQAIPDCRLDRYAETIMALERRNVSALFPGHGFPDTDAERVRSDLRAAAETFSRLVPPPNYLT